MKENRRKKKSLIALLILVIVGVIGFTLAYFSDSITIGNEFKTKEYGMSVTEVFVSPDNWTPGTTTEKSVVATNTGQVDEAVRISYTEKWVAADGTELSGWVDENGKLTSHDLELATDERAAIINFDNESDWTLSNGYYYYNYKLAPTESTSSLIKSVTFNSLVTSDSSCKTVENTTTCTSTKKGYDGATYTLTFTIETVQYDQYKSAWGTSVDIASEKLKTGVQTLLSKANGADVINYIDGDTKEMYTFSHEETEQTGALTDYRYIGDSPNNYVKFNCDENGENCETWRIVGVFSVDDGTGKFEQRIKLVRGELLTNNDTENDDWYENLYAYWDANKVNEWSTATLKTYLNGSYFNDELTENAKSMIENAKYYLGGGKSHSNTPYGSTEDMYTWERGTEVFEPSTNGWKCNYTVTENGACAIRTTEWTGQVALLYPSDYGYTYSKEVDSTCYDNPSRCYFDKYDEVFGYPEKGWIYNSNVKGTGNPASTWLLSPYADRPDDALIVYGLVYGNGGVGADYDDFGQYVGGVRPVVYLSSDVKITGGDGSSSNPYILSK